MKTELKEIPADNIYTAIGMYRNSKGWVSFEVKIEGDKIIERVEQPSSMKVSAFSRLKIDFIRLFWRDRARKK